MATLLLPEKTTGAVPPLEEATLVLVLSPIRGADGQLHVARAPLAVGQTVAEALQGSAYGRVVWNGAVLDETQQTQVVLQAGDEVTAFPPWGDATFWIFAGISFAVSLIMTAANYLLFPPTKPHVEASPEPHTFSFSGIRTAVGPGNIKPVVYGTHRMGGQLLAASVDHYYTVLDQPGVERRVQALTNPPTLTLLLAMGEGPIYNIDLNSIEINGQPIQNFPGTQGFIRYGTPTQAPIPEFNETRNTFADGRNLPDNSSNTDQQILYTTTDVVDAYVLNIVWNQGLVHFNDKGEKEDNSVVVSYRDRVYGTSTWGGWSNFQVQAQRAAPVRFGIRKEGLGHVRYDIAVNFGAIRHSTEGRSSFQPTLESVTQVQAGAQAYPNTALLGLRALPSEQLQGALPNVTVLVSGRTVRVGSFSAAETWTDNPAWCIMDLLTNPRYGAGIGDGEIDLAAFAMWGAYCDEIFQGETRHRFNYVLEREGRLQGILMELMGGSRTLMLKSEGLWTPRPTRNDPPGPLFSWATCSNLVITYTRDPDRVNVMEARFANEETGYEQDILVWPPIDQWPVEVHKASLELRGVTKPSRVMRALQYELNRRKWENCIIEFDNALDAVTLQPHDLFRFSHPLPGWGQSGRVAEGSTQTRVYLDQPVSLGPGTTYHLYLRHIDDTTEARTVYNPGTVVNSYFLDFGVGFSFIPTPRDTLWALGTATPDTAARTFRAVRVERKSDTTVRIQAVIHNPSIYDEPVAVPLQVPPGLFNPLGPPPPITSLIAHELTRVQPSGASYRVVNLAWDVGGLGPGYAPYGGAQIFRRTVLINATTGLVEAGMQELGSITNPNDPNVNFTPLVNVSGHVLETDDYTIVNFATYVYRVVPISTRGVPNNTGAREVQISVAGATTPDYFPGTVRNLRLKGQPVGATTWEGRDCAVQWDAVDPALGLFSDTFFVKDYIVQVWAPAQVFHLRSSETTALEFLYTYTMNQEDSLRNAGSGPSRELLFVVYARTNTNRISATPARLQVLNPPPDMSMIIPEVSPLADSAVLEWDQYFEPRDFDHYEVHLDITNPPVAIYTDYSSSGIHGVGSSFRKMALTGLTPGTTYYAYILPWDSFGPGIPSQTISFIPIGWSAEFLDSIPPAVPTGLTLTSATEMDMAAGVWQSNVVAHWNANTESDLAGYEIVFRVGDNPSPTSFQMGRVTSARLFNVGGNLLVKAQLAAYDQVHNVSEFCPEVSVTTGRDTTVPGLPRNMVARGSFKAIALLWTPPSDLDYRGTEVWASQTTTAGSAVKLTEAYSDFVHEGLQSNATWYYWFRAVDTSDNMSAFVPAEGLSATTIQTSSADIGNLSITETAIANNAISTPKLQANSVDANKITTGEFITLGAQIRAAIITDAHITALSASKIETGTLDVFVSLGVANRIQLDGTVPVINIYDTQATPIARVQIGRLGSLSNEWGMMIRNNLGQLMYHFSDGTQTPGIASQAITGNKIAAGVIEASHLIAGTVITRAAQIGAAVIEYAHIKSVSAEAIQTGILTATVAIGAGQMWMDGSQAQLRIMNPEGTLYRVALGVIPDAGDYGLKIWNSLGQVMWELNSGVSTAGVQDFAITSAKIDNLAVKNAHIENLTVGTAKLAYGATSQSILGYSGGGGGTSSYETEYGYVEFSNIEYGEVIWLVGACTARGGGSGGVTGYMVLREDQVGYPTPANGGLQHHVASINQGNTADTPNAYGTLVVQGLFTNLGGTIPYKKFVLGHSGTHIVSEVRLTAVRFKR